MDTLGKSVRVAVEELKISLNEGSIQLISNVVDENVDDINYLLDILPKDKAQ